MKLKASFIIFVLLLPFSSQAMESDDPLLFKLMIDQLEQRANDDGDEYVLDGRLWAGYDLHKFWLKTDVERFDGKTEESEVQALYSRAVAPYWDLQLGVRRDFRPEPQRDWLVLGFEGLAPYYFELDAVLFIRESGHSAARLEAEYELLFTQRLILAPEIEINVASKDDPKVGIGSGLTDIEVGLRLRYEIRREFAPYIGVNWKRRFGQTADYIRAAGEEVVHTQLVAGLRVWF